MKFFAIFLLIFVLAGGTPAHADGGGGWGGFISWLESLFDNEDENEDGDDGGNSVDDSGATAPGMTEEELEEEATALAQQIAASATSEVGTGGSEQYHDYARKLAITLSQLDGNESNRVFGN
ncbi:MAG: hypothetical protein AAF514_15835 [Verrucomicrobiota bacterium]